MTALRTERLVLRRWRDSDLAPWAAMNADPEVREHLGDLLTREQSGRGARPAGNTAAFAAAAGARLALRSGR